MLDGVRKPHGNESLTAALLSLYVQTGPMHSALLDRPACPKCEGLGHPGNIGKVVPCAACGGTGWRR